MMGSASKELCHDKVARMPPNCPEELWMDHPHPNESLERLSCHHTSSGKNNNRPTRCQPLRRNPSARRPKFARNLNHSPAGFRRSARQIKSGDAGSFLSSPSHSRSNSCDFLVCGGLKASSRHGRSSSRDWDSSSKVYNSEADFLIQNQLQFAPADFAAVLAALAEESQIDEERKQQEEQSILLARKLASGEGELEEDSASDDLTALVVALRAEVDESQCKRKEEEESFRLAFQLVTEEAQACGVLQALEENSEKPPQKRMPQSNASCFLHVQCKACHFNVEKEDELRELPCGHHYHAFCINRWFLTNRKDCPYCRAAVA